MRVIADAAQEAGLATRKAFSNLSQAQAFISSVDCTYSFEEKQAYIQNKIDLLPFHNGDVAGLRVDVCLENTETGETKWIDTTVVHTTCASYRAKELKSISERKLNVALTEMHMLHKAVDRNPSLCLLDRETEKPNKYGRPVIVWVHTYNSFCSRLGLWKLPP